MPRTSTRGADAHAVARGQHDVVRAVGHLHVDQLVALVDVDGADTRRARIPELGQLRLLHHALLGGEEEELVVGERRTGTSDAMCSSGRIAMQFTTGLPRAARAACGTSCTLSQ